MSAPVVGLLVTDLRTSWIRRATYFAHKALSRVPRPIQFAYISVLSGLCRTVLPRPLAQRIRNSISGHDHRWSSIEFAPRKVRVGTGTTIALGPHIGEFDEEALFSRKLEYEVNVFAWLERNVPQTYDMVIEIGANVGVYTVFFDRLLRRSTFASRAVKVVAFEPSREAYRRLLKNLDANRVSSVASYCAAVGVTSGLRPLFAPQGHLTNGSLLREFAEIFSPSIDEHLALVMAATELEQWIAPSRRPLLKIDVEGYEPTLIGALQPLLQKYRPDILLEVLPFTLDGLKSSEALAGYDCFLITSEGLAQSSSLFASDSDRDWLLRWHAR